MTGTDLHQARSRPGTGVPTAGGAVRVLFLAVLVGATLVGPDVTVPAAAAVPIVVTATDDVVDGADGVISLREAFTLATTDGVASEIHLQAGATYDLTRCDLGDAGALEDWTLEGVTLDGKGATIRQTCAGGVVELSGGPVTVKNVTIRNGDRAAGCCSGGLYVYTQDDDILIQDVVITGNANQDGSGGGGLMANAGVGTTTIERSVLAGNHAAYSGGGLRVTGDVVLRDSAVVDNRSDTHGGGFFVGGTATLSNVTVAGNDATWSAGGRVYGSANLTHVGVVTNETTQSSPQLEVFGSLTVAGTVFADPVAGKPNCSIGVLPVTSLGHNYSTDLSCGSLTQPGDVQGGSQPGLRSSWAIGGTWALYPEASSPLLDVVPGADPELPDGDQRGEERPQGGGGEVGPLEVVPCGSLFSDVLAAHPFCWEIGWLSAAEVTGGFADGTFRPGAGVTRQSMAAFLYRLAGSPAFTPPASPTFPDVGTAHPFFAEVEWLADTGVTGGFADGTFRPGAGVTRQSMAAFLHRLAGSPLIESPGQQFSDVPVDHPFFGQIAWLAHEGVTGGFADGTFRPGAGVTRQSMAAFLYRYAATLAVEV